MGLWGGGEKSIFNFNLQLMWAWERKGDKNRKKARCMGEKFLKKKFFLINIKLKVHCLVTKIRPNMLSKKIDIPAERIDFGSSGWILWGKLFV